MDIKAKLCEYVLPANETLYKGMNEELFSLQYPKPIWFSQRHETASQYGTFVHKFVTKRPLKLINVSSPYFQSTFMDFLNDFYRQDENARNLQLRMLSPLGLPDEESQQRYLSTMGIRPRVSQANREVYQDIAFFYNRHRFSHACMDYDLAKFMQSVYHQYHFDGYIAPCVWPSKYHVQFSDEVCIFDIRNADFLVHVTTNHVGMTAGGRKDEHVFSPQAIERITMESLEQLRKCGWTEDYELSKEGFLVHPDSYTLGSLYNKMIADKKAKETADLLKRQSGGSNKKPRQRKAK